MSEPSVGQGGPPPGDARQLRLLRALLLAGALLEILNAAYILSQPELSYRAVPAMSGAAIAVLLAGTALSPRVTLRTLQVSVVAVLCVWFGLNAAGVMVTQRPIASGLLLQVVTIALFAYTWLPERGATTTVGAVYAVLIAACARSVRPDVPGVALTGFILPLVWYLTAHGRATRHERGRAVEWQALALTDPLTGTLNRRAGMDALNGLLARSAGSDVMVVLIDLDHFKRVNDEFGHARGDDVLVEVAGVLRAALDDGDVLARWGGEEFLAALPGTAAETTLRVQHALGAVRSAHVPGGAGQPLTVSAGAALLRETPSVHGTLELADRRLYRAKAAGRDRLVTQG